MGESVDVAGRGRVRGGARPEGGAHRGGFTLAELLVVIGIVAALAAILLPAAGRVRESSRRVACLARVRQLTQATLAYAADNDGWLPNATATNDSVESPLCPRNNAAPPGSNAGNGMTVLPSIAACLAPYGLADPQLWRCPSAPAESFRFEGPDPYSGMTYPNRFTPNVHYMADKEWYFQAVLNGPVTRQTRLRVWATRNVSGLRVNRVAPLGGNAQVVLFHDKDSTYHADSRPHSGDVGFSIYTSPTDWRYYANFGFLDGHAEGRVYVNVDGYLANIHGPVRQSWWGVDFSKVFAEQYEGY